MTHNDFSNGGLFNQISQTSFPEDDQPKRGGMITGLLSAIITLALAGGAYWFFFMGA